MQARADLAATGALLLSCACGVWAAALPAGPAVRCKSGSLWDLS